MRWASVNLVASAGLDIDTDGVFDDERTALAWLFAALIVVIAFSSALIVWRRSSVRWKRWLAGAGLVMMCAAAIVGTRPHDIAASPQTDGEEVLCGPVLALIRTDPAECGGRMQTHRRVVQGLAVSSVAMLAVARVAAYPEHREAKRARRAQKAADRAAR